MKIAIPSEGESIDSSVEKSFGRTYYFAVVDSDTFELSVVDNKGAASQGGAGIKAAQSIVDSGADAVITFQCGQNAADVLKAADIKIYKAIPGTVKDMVNKYNNGELSELSEIHQGYHNHGGA